MVTYYLITCNITLHYLQNAISKSLKFYLESLFINHKILSVLTTKIHQFWSQNLSYRRKYVHFRLIRINSCLYYNENQKVLSDHATLWNWLIGISALKIGSLYVVILLISMIKFRCFVTTKNIRFYTRFYKKVKHDEIVTYDLLALTQRYVLYYKV